MRQTSLFMKPASEQQLSSDDQAVQRAVNALISESQAKQEHTLAKKLAKLLPQNAPGGRAASMGQAWYDHVVPDRVRDLLSITQPRRLLSDLILPEAVIGMLQQFIFEQKRADVLRANGLEPRHTVLLVGAPGTGKTSMAEGIATELGLPFFSVRYDAVIGSYLGETATRLRNLTDFVATTPCVLFFDEFDAIGKERGDLHETGEIKRVVNSLLLQLDSLPSYTVVICATNHPELLDRAVWRRFELRLELPIPTKKQLVQWFNNVLGILGFENNAAANRFATVFSGAGFSEADQFFLDVRRRIVLSMGDATPARVVQEVLSEREAQVSSHPRPELRENGGRSSNSSHRPKRRRQADKG